MSSAFPLPFKVYNQDIWQNHTLKFYTMYPCVAAIHHPFVCKYKQLFHKQSQNNSRLVFSRFFDNRGNLGNDKEKPTRKTCFSREKKRLTPRIYQAKFCLAAFL